jgi:stage II sporulation protein D
VRRLALLLPVLLVACGGEDTAGPPPVPRIRVLLRSIAGAPATTVRFPAPWRETDAATGEEVARGASLSRELALAGARIDGPLRFETDGEFAVGGRRYRGALLLVPGEDGVLPIVETDLESYAPGVLAGELGRAFPAAALRAQAVASRTYALSRIQDRPADRPYDVADDTSDQRFLGLVGAEDAALSRAAADTRGLVLTDGHGPITAYFHSTCGGHTASGHEVFEVPESAPLGGVPCRWCVRSSKYRWQVSFPLAAVASRLGLEASPGAVTVDRSPRTGRALTLRFGEAAVPAAEVRSRLGVDRFLSCLLSAVEMQGSEVRFEGRGWGHGVGMCQMGATGMAKEGASAGDILAHYYPGATLSRIY